MHVQFAQILLIVLEVIYILHLEYTNLPDTNRRKYFPAQDPSHMMNCSCWEHMIRNVKPLKITSDYP